jgi:xylose dehydrogenase (NAD/NADP)
MALPSSVEALTERDWDTEPDGTVRLAVVGVGGFSRHAVLPALADADYCRPSVLVSGSLEPSDPLVDEHGVRVIDYDAYGAGEASDAYDAVYVATPNARHLPHVETAAALGKPVLCEKPLEATVERGEQLLAACADAGVTLMTAYRMQTDPVVRWLRSFVADGGLGELTTLHGDFTYPTLGGSRGPDQWRLDPALAGGGALADVGVYPLNTARFLLDADPTELRGVTASTGAFSDVDGRVAFLAAFPGDVSGAFTASFTGPTDTHLTVAGSEGRARLEDAFQVRTDRTLRLETADGNAVFEGVGVDEVREEFDYFAHCVLTNRQPEPDGEDGLADLRAMRAVYRDAGLDVPMAE